MAAAAAKRKGLKLESLVGKMVKVKDGYKDNAEGPFECLGFDSGWVCLKVADKPFWWSMKDFEGIMEYVEEEVEAKEETPVG